jgi:hypothetical protein
MNLTRHSLTLCSAENRIALGALIRTANEYAHRVTPVQGLVSAMITVALKRLEVEASASTEVGHLLR